MSKKILITGASGAIGNAVAQNLDNLDFIVGLHGYTRKSEFKASKCKNLFYQSDLSTKESCYDIVDQFVNSAGGINGFVQLHGNVNRPCHWSDLTVEDWNADLYVNMISPFFTAQRAIHHMKNTGGSVVLMSTASASHGGGTDSLAYGVAKAGVECITKRLAKDVSSDGIRVNAIAPGFINTDFHTKRLNRSPEKLKNRGLTIPLKRIGTVNDVAKTIIYLLNNENNFTNGQVLTVDGGDFI